MSFKDFSSFRCGSHFAQHSGTIGAILVEGIMRNICEIILNLDQVQDEMSCKEKVKAQWKKTDHMMLFKHSSYIQL